MARFDVCSRRDFSRMSGLVSAPVHLTDDMSEYARVVKEDLVATLKHFGLGWVEYFTDAGEVFFVGAYATREEAGLDNVESTEV